MKERLLAAMERKRHASWRGFVEGRVPRAALAVHYEQEWEVFARDFPVLLARILAMAPPDDVRAMLAETIYEEQTGALSGGGPHAAMLSRLIAALRGGEAAGAATPVVLLPEAAAFRAVLDDVTRGDDWLAAVAVVCVFVEGSWREREVLAAAEARGGAALPDADVDAAVAAHPLRVRYGVADDALAPVRVHVRHEPRRRLLAWRALEHARPADEERVVAAVERALAAWLAFREAIARVWEA